MASASFVHSLKRLAVRPILFAIVVVLLAMAGLAMLAEALNSDGGTVYLAGIEAGGQPGGVPSLAAIGYGQATAPAERAAFQLVFSDIRQYHDGQIVEADPSPDATPGAAEQAAATPIVAALVAVGVPEEAINVVTSEVIKSDFYAPEFEPAFRIDFVLQDPTQEMILRAIDQAVLAAAQRGLTLLGTRAADSVADCGPVRDRAWHIAAADARARADAQAVQLGVTLGELLLAQENTSPATILLAGPPDTCGTISFTREVTVVRPGFVTLPTFDPGAAPVVFTTSQVTLAFAIVRD